MPRKKEPFPVAFAFYECPICHKKGSIGFVRDADEDQPFETGCEHKIPITVEGRIAREARLDRAAAARAEEGTDGE